MDLLTAVRLAEMKARKVAGTESGAIVIGADTFVVLGNEVLGKPHTVPKALAMLRRISGRSHSIVTGFTIIDTKKKKIVLFTRKNRTPGNGSLTGRRPVEQIFPPSIGYTFSRENVFLYINIYYIRGACQDVFNNPRVFT